MCSDWRPVVPFYQQIQERKDDAAEKMSASREDSAGNVVESCINERVDFKKNIKWEIYTMKFSPPVRKLHDNSDLFGHAEQDRFSAIEQPKEPSEPDPPEPAPEEPAKQEAKQDGKGLEAKAASSSSKSASISSDGMTGSQASWNKSGSQAASRAILAKPRDRMYLCSKL